MLSVVTIGTTAFASPQLLFDSEEGIGIEVHCSNPNARGDIEDNYTSCRRDALDHVEKWKNI